MKNDIKTSSTDFLPVKPGSDSPTQSTAATPASKPGVPAAALAAKPTPAGMAPPSKHIIDLKNVESTVPKDSKDFMVKNNPFLQNSTPDSTKPEPTNVAVASDSVKAEEKMPEPPMPTQEDIPAGMKKIDDSHAQSEAPKPGMTEKPPSMDLAHPESEKDEHDELRAAMVSHDPGPPKAKKKMPTWLLVIIIVIAVFVVAIGTFAALNALARP